MDWAFDDINGQIQTKISVAPGFLNYLNKFKIWPRPLIRLRTNPTCHPKPNPSHEIVPISVSSCQYRTVVVLLLYSHNDHKETP
jgi:hypothetical protein